MTVADGPIDDRNAGVVQMPDGENVVTFFTSIAYRTREKYFAEHPQYQAYDSKLTDKIRMGSLGYFRTSSKDNGKTWSKPERMQGVSHAYSPEERIFADVGTWIRR